MIKDKDGKAQKSRKGCGDSRAITVISPKTFRIFKLGNEDRPATQKEIDNFSGVLKKAYKQGTDLVTHHAVTTEVIPNDSMAMTSIYFQLYDRNLITPSELKKYLGVK